MPSHLLRDLGYDTRRMRILLRLPEWEWLDAYSRRCGNDVASIIGAFVGDSIERHIDNERVILTPKGEAAADEPAITRSLGKLIGDDTE